MNIQYLAGSGIIMCYKLLSNFHFVEENIQTIQTKTNFVISQGDIFGKILHLNFILSNSKFIGLCKPLYLF